MNPKSIKPLFFYLRKTHQCNYWTIKHCGLISIGYGMMLPVGHMDFYPNGGSNQPGCPRQSFMNIITEEYEDGTYGTMHKRPTDSLIMQTGFSHKQQFFSLILLITRPKVLILINTLFSSNCLYLFSLTASCYFLPFVETGNIISCSHSRSIVLFTESINSPCAFRSFQCSNTRDFMAGNCFNCGGLPCPMIGYDAIRYRARGKFYLATRSNTPFCGNAFLMSLVNNFYDSVQFSKSNSKK